MHLSASKADQEMQGAEEQQPQKERPEQSLVMETLDTIKEHQLCLQAHYLMSRGTFRILRRPDRAKKEFRVKSLQRKMADSEQEMTWSA